MKSPWWATRRLMSGLNRQAVPQCAQIVKCPGRGSPLAFVSDNEHAA